MTPPAAGSGHLLAVVVDEWAAPERPADDVPAMLSRGDFVVSKHRNWQLDAMLAGSIRNPSALAIVTGI